MKEDGDACPHYLGLPTLIRPPLSTEKWKHPRAAICECGICLGYVTKGQLGYNPLLNSAQRDSTHRFLLGRGIVAA